MALSDKLSNIIGVKIPDDILKQLRTRSEKNSMENRDTNNVVYLESKTAWVRLVSSVNVTREEDKRYFSGLGIPMTDETSLAKNFVLYSGTSKYFENLQNNTLSWGYQQRNGILDPYGSYSPLGERETREYGFRPMPGITGVTIENQGRLGSIRAATINFKCWDKFQLDIIDTLYFKLGFTMFLEWGHAVYYDQNSPNELSKSEVFSLDPFIPGLYKELIQQYVSKNSRFSRGNYDAMLGMVTNFNFSLNQDLGFDCTLNLISLGSLADSVKINGLGSSAEAINIINQVRGEERTRIEEEARGIGLSEIKDKKIFNIERFTAKTLREYIINQGVYTLHYSPSSEESKKETADLEFPLTKVQGAGNSYVLLAKSEKLLNFDPESNNKASINVEEFKKRIEIASANSSQPPYVENLQILPTSTKDLSSFLTSDSSGIVRPIGNIVDPTIIYNYKIKNREYSIRIYLPLKLKAQNKEGVDPDFGWRSINFSSDNEVVEKGIYSSRSKGIDAVINAFYEGLKSQNTFYADSTFRKIRYVFTVPITLSVPNVPAEITTKESEGKETTVNTKVTVDYTANAIVSIFEDTDLIENVVSGLSTQPTGYPGEISAPKDPVADETTPPAEGATDQNPAKKVNQDQSSDNAFQNLSTLEAALWSLRLHTISKYNSTKQSKNANEEPPKKKFHTQDIVEDGFYKTIFAGGVFSPFLTDLVEGKIDDTDYDNITKKARNKFYDFKVLSKYGFATNLLTGYTNLFENVNGARSYNFVKVDFRDLLKTYLISYPFKSRNSIPNIEQNEAVYMKLGALLMLINNNCTMYDSSDGRITSTTPLVYIDFNPNHNFCLSCPQHLSTDPKKVLIPFEGTLSDYRTLFPKDIIQNNQIGYISGSQFVTEKKKNTYLFNPLSLDKEQRNGNIVSPEIPPFKMYGTLDGNTNSYRGNVMNIMLNIDYLISLVREIAESNDENKVFLNEFMNRLLLDITKSLGNFNSFRLSYSDAANCIQIVDDQVISSGKESTLSRTAPPDEYELPLYGKNSIAKTLEIRTEITSRLNHMIAISANSNKKQYSGGDDASSYGFINEGLKDRYVPQRGEIGLEETSATQELAAAATNFNTAVKKIYAGIESDMDDSLVEAATSYYVEWLNRRKNDDVNTKASAMIPVSVNFTTDGISGITNGHAFTIPKQILPYVYTTDRNIDNVNLLNRVGFAITGLTNTIENNVWTTSVKADMIFLKGKIEQGNKEIIESQNVFNESDSVNSKGEYLTYVNGNKSTYEPVVIMDNGELVIQKYYPYLKKMSDAMNKEISLSIVLKDGFRTFGKQYQLRQQNVITKAYFGNVYYLLHADEKQFKPVTARPGYSDHQNGTAYDIDVSNSQVFNWLKKNAIKYRFVRTEPSERWHWEYKPGVKNTYAFVKENDTSWN